MTYQSYGQLLFALNNLSSPNANVELNSVAFQSAWSVVDNIDRLNSFLKTCQIGKLESKQFMQEVIREMRNTYHHGYDRFKDCVNLKYPLMGTLRWFYTSDVNATGVDAFILASGSHIGEVNHSIKIPKRSSLDIPVGNVALSSVIKFKEESRIESLNMSEVMQEIDSYVNRIIEHFSIEFKTNGTEVNAVQDILSGFKIHYSTDDKDKMS
jgi:hypothetical protein